MSKYAIQVEKLAKRYRIGRSIQPRNGKGTLSERLSSPFRYLTSTLREPAVDEIIWALKDVSFNVNPGEVVGIIGSNGAGKSTLLKILSRITEPTSGRAIVDGRVGSLLEVGTGFHPELTGRENIYLNGAILGMKRPEIDRKFDEIVAFAETERFLDTPVKRYSSGMYVRLAFAVAAHLDPEVLLVDEVLAVGDAAFQKKCLGKMSDIATQGRTVLFVSHNMVAVQNLCERVIWLQDGRIVEEGPTAEVISGYLSTSFEALSERIWSDFQTSPGNEKVRIYRVCVRPEDGVSSDPISMDSSLIVEVEYWNLVPDARLHITLQFYTEQQIIAFSTFSIEADTVYRGKLLNQGLYRSVCHIPGNLLNAGTYKLYLLVVQNSDTVIYRYDGIVTFQVLELSNRHVSWYGKVAGAVHPLLMWKTEYLGKSQEYLDTNRHQGG